jgi:DNA anti-recombination protein RmuC
VIKRKETVAKFVKQGMKRFRVVARNDALFVIPTTLTVILNLIQNLFDVNEQNETIAKFAKQGMKRFRVKHGMTTFSLYQRP